MLPCQGQCPNFQTGCHKTCAHWRQYLSQQQKEREAKTAYLRFYFDLCDTVTRQLRAVTVRYPAR